MGKIVCDVCGTTYQDTAAYCPICGCTQDDAAAMLSDERMMDELINGRAGSGIGSGSSRKKEIFDFDEVNSFQEPALEEESGPYEREVYYEEAPRQNTLAIILLTVLITVLLMMAAFLFVRIYLPGVLAGEPAETTLPPVVETTTMPTETTELRIPCENLALTSGMASGSGELVNPGQKFLINVIASPENTTDPIIFTSADESIATVTDDGQVVAVGEGETVIYISCGEVTIPCKVVCNFSKETEPTTEATTETTVPIELKLNREDMTLPYRSSFQLLLVGSDLDEADLEWRSGNKGVAIVDDKGYVTAVGYGNTTVTAKYGNQEVTCVVRCNG